MNNDKRPIPVVAIRLNVDSSIEVLGSNNNLMASKMPEGKLGFNGHETQPLAHESVEGGSVRWLTTFV
jgi:hypothetical protein